MADLTTDDHRTLLELARSSIAAHLANRRLPELEAPSPPLAEPRGAFVTLRLDGELRGCIGHVVATEPLWCSVRSNAMNAAFHDPRFPQLTVDELPQVRIEISALTPLQEISRPEEITIGRDGLMIEKGPWRGLLLPQVATELGCDAHAFLDATCRKAGLPPGEWRSPEARLLRFSAEVFAEPE
jgi:AmmeMemoRadiSam system protein A